jgi:hypothetical protein
MQIWRDTHATNSQSELQHTGGCIGHERLKILHYIIHRGVSGADYIKY